MRARVLLSAMLAVVLLIGRPVAGVGQFPRGLLAGESKAHSCTIETRPLSFGAYDPLAGTVLDAVGAIIYVCGSGNPGEETTGPKNIRIEMARGSSNSYSDRTMLGPSFDPLHYNIYLDATRQTIWGDGTNGTEYYFDAHPPNKTPVTVPAYGRIRALQDVEAGQYADVLPVRILF